MFAPALGLAGKIGDAFGQLLAPRQRQPISFEREKDLTHVLGTSRVCLVSAFMRSLVTIADWRTQIVQHRERTPGLLPGRLSPTQVANG